MPESPHREHAPLIKANVFMFAFTLLTAAARHDQLRAREALTWTADDQDDAEAD